MGSLRHHRRRCVLGQSRPPRSNANSSAPILILVSPGSGVGQLNVPRSSRFAQIQSPLESQTSIFRRVWRLLVKTKRYPLSQFPLRGRPAFVLRNDPVNVATRVAPPDRREEWFFHARQPTNPWRAPSDGVPGTDTIQLRALLWVCIPRGRSRPPPAPIARRAAVCPSGVSRRAFNTARKWPTNAPVNTVAWERCPGHSCDQNLG